MTTIRGESTTVFMRRTNSGKRLHLLDTIRGITLISMIAYHTAWDLVYIAGINWPWYHSRGAYVWQQSICWTFILLSGLCNVLSVHKWRRGLLVFASGLLVTAATLVFLPEDRVIFGVLTLIGSAMLIFALIGPGLKNVPPSAGILVCALLFYVFRPVNDGLLQLWPGKQIPLPSGLYHGMTATYFGFMDPTFYSTDYFSILPWIFLYGTGVFLGRFLNRRGLLRTGFFRLNIPPLSFLGRHSLLIYLLHQPVIYMVIVLLTRAGIL